VTCLGCVGYLTTLSATRLQHSVGWWDDWRMTDWKGFGWKWSWSNRDTIPSFVSKRLTETAKMLSQNSRVPSQDSNRAPPEYKSRPLPLVIIIRAPSEHNSIPLLKC
jgi:hypothetical protein